jgi:hypothetical protein
MNPNEIRFAVGRPSGLTSNSWKIWSHTDPNHEVRAVYIACRDNFNEVKVSLHPSGRWRIGFTQEAHYNNPNLKSTDNNRAWEVWDKPIEQIPDVTIAYRLVFHSDSIRIKPLQRNTKLWKKPLIYIEDPPSNKLTIVTVFIAKGNKKLTHSTEISHEIAIFELGNDLFAHVVAHAEKMGTMENTLSIGLKAAILDCTNQGVELKENYYAYFHGNMEDGSHFLAPLAINSKVRDL